MAGRTMSTSQLQLEMSSGNQSLDHRRTVGCAWYLETRHRLSRPLEVTHPVLSADYSITTTTLTTKYDSSNKGTHHPTGTKFSIKTRPEETLSDLNRISRY